MTIDENDDLYFSDRTTGIRKISKDGSVTSLTSNTSGIFGNTNVLVRDSFGNFYTGGMNQNSYLLKVSPSGVVSRLAGVATPGLIRGYADGKGDTARFGGFVGLTVDPSGNLVASDYEHHTIRKIVPVAP